MAEPETPAGRGGAPALVAAATFLIACAIPIALFLSVGLKPDETADRVVSAGTLAFLIGIDLAVGATASGLVWWLMRSTRGSARSITVAFLVFGATAWGLIVGFLGTVAIATERHPGWDDA